MAMRSGHFFNTIPTLPYETFDGSGEYKVVVDIFKRVRATLEARTDGTIYYDYVVKDGETPEIISYKYYGAAKYHWVILLMNQIRDPQWDWPLDSKSFNEFVSNKYGSLSSALSENSHYETVEIKASVTDSNYNAGDIIVPEGLIVNSDYSYSYSGGDYDGSGARVAVNKFDMELNKNEEARNIILLRRSLVHEFVEEFETLVIDKR